MSYSKTQIANLGLSHARETIINGDIDTSTESVAETARLFYDQVLNQMLRRIKPAFAQTRTTLTVNATAPTFEYDYAYDLPVDFVDIIAFNGADIGRTNDYFEIEGRQILTTEDEANIVYIKLEEDTSLYDAEFIEALAYMLGSKVVESKRGDRGLADDLLKMAMMSASASRAKAMQARRVWNQRDLVRYSSRWSGATRRISTADSASEVYNT